MEEPFDLVDQGDPGDHPDEMRATPGTYSGGDELCGAEAPRYMGPWFCTKPRGHRDLEHTAPGGECGEWVWTVDTVHPNAEPNYPVTKDWP